MQFYRCYLLDARYQIAAVELLRCERDVDARQRADALLVQRPAFHGVEVWERDRRVHINLVGVEDADEPGDLADARRLAS
jgi:hypothetical protein